MCAPVTLPPSPGQGKQAAGRAAESIAVLTPLLRGHQRSELEQAQTGREQHAEVELSITLEEPQKQAVLYGPADRHLRMIRSRAAGASSDSATIVRRRASSCAISAVTTAEVVATESLFGGGTTPEKTFPSAGLAIRSDLSAARLAAGCAPLAVFAHLQILLTTTRRCEE